MKIVIEGSEKNIKEFRRLNKYHFKAKNLKVEEVESEKPKETKKVEKTGKVEVKTTPKKKK